LGKRRRLVVVIKERKREREGGGRESERRREKKDQLEILRACPLNLLNNKTKRDQLVFSNFN
jgi:hypothetical protein